MSLPVTRLLNAMYYWLLERVGERDKVHALLRGETVSFDDDEPEEDTPRPGRFSEEEEQASALAFMGAMGR